MYIKYLAQFDLVLIFISLDKNIVVFFLQFFVVFRIVFDKQELGVQKYLLVDLWMVRFFGLVLLQGFFF